MTSSCGVRPAGRDDLAGDAVEVGEVDLHGVLPDVTARYGGQRGVVRERVALPVVDVEAEPVDGHDRGNSDDVGHVALAGLDDLVDEPGDVVTDQTLHPRHGGRCGDRVDDLAPLAELGRVDLDRDVEGDRGLRDHDREPVAAVLGALGRERLVVAGRLEHGLVVGEHPVTAVRLGPGDRRLLAKRTIGPGRVGRMLIGVVVEVHHGTTASLGHGQCLPGVHNNVIMVILNRGHVKAAPKEEETCRFALTMRSVRGTDCVA